MNLWTSLLTKIGIYKPEPVAKPSAYTEPEIQERPLWDQFSRIGGELGPQQVSTILRQADMGQPARFVDLVHEGRQKDGHLHCTLQTSELAISGLPWDCVAPEGSLLRDKKVAEATKQALRGAAGFATMLAHLTGEGKLFGHSTSEVIWWVDQDGDGYMKPLCFQNLSCRRFGFRQSDGALLFDPNQVGTVDVDGEDLLAEYPLGKFIQYRPRVNGDVPVREGLGRVLIWAAIFRNWGLRDWLLLGEVGWKPSRLGYYKKGASKEDIDRLNRTMASWVANGAATLPDTTEAHVDWPKNNVGGVSTHKELSEHLAGEMSKAVLGQTLTTESGSRGARSLGEVHDGIRKDIREADAIGIAFVIKHFLVEPFVRLNFGPKAAIPEFFFLTEDKIDLKAFAEAIATLRKAGMRIPESYVQDQTGIPEPDSDDILLGDQVDENGERVQPDTEPDPNEPDPDAGSEDAEGQDGAGQDPAAEAA